ncbi:MAG: hypothetical protein K8R13_05555 [Methanococcoides sp.]|nr:hypothetical protein [Methanococcoides sp.]
MLEGAQFGTFLFGAFGALLLVYISKDVAIPEFRPLYDISDMQREARRHRKHIEKTESDIDSLQDRLRSASISDDAQVLSRVLESYLTEVEAERARLHVLEKEIKNGQLLSRGLGFFFYIVLGGVFGTLLSGQVNITFVSEGVSNFLESFVIGATWTSYLSSIGIRSTQRRVGGQVDKLRDEFSRDMERYRKDLKEQIFETANRVNADLGVEEGSSYELLWSAVSEKLDDTGLKFVDELDETKRVIDNDVKGLL